MIEILFETELKKIKNIFRFNTDINDPVHKIDIDINIRPLESYSKMYLYWLIDWLLFNAKWAICQLYPDKNKLYFDEIIMAMSAVC